VTYRHRTDALLPRYVAGLSAFLGSNGGSTADDETTLEEAYEIGRAMIDAKGGVVDLASLHAAAVESLAPTGPAVARASRFLTEALAPFEMTLRGFEELNRTLEARVAERTTELERAQAMFLQSQKLETIGRLAGGVAHDFNNLLSVIVLNAETLIDTTTDEATKVQLQEMLNAGFRAAELTRQLLAFSRQQVLAPTIQSPNTIIAGLERLLSRLLGERIALRTELSPDCGVVNVDRVQLEQVIINLVVNARDAMPDGGDLTILTAPRAGAVVISVADSGTGIAPELMERIFEPFFTTKPEGRGTGLGLATCYGIVRQSGGEISVQSTVGVGTRFDVALPTVSGDPTEATSTQAAAQKGRPARVLVVEDDEVVRRATVRILASGGHVVSAARDGLDALEVLATAPQPIEVVVSDVAMPRMGGLELGERIRQQYPHVRVLFVSGYGDEEVRARGGNNLDFMQKPVRPVALLDKVRELLER
jgi:signal transduction histidine kinase